MTAMKPAKSDGIKSVDVAPNPKPVFGSKSKKSAKKKTPMLDKYRQKKGC